MERLVRRFYHDLWNRWDDEGVEELLHEDFTFRGSLGTETRGRDEWRSYRDAVRAGSSDFHNEILDLVADGDRAAARLRYTGSHTGPLAGLPATGRRFSYAGAAFFTGDARQLTSAWVLGDLTALREQLG
ncbi:MAG TPA: ester cyclase [Nocardioides sp.]|nr:ester cyclase [Nocardioides sp.]